jgi:hypothetical protein
MLLLPFRIWLVYGWLFVHTMKLEAKPDKIYPRSTEFAIQPF